MRYVPAPCMLSCLSTNFFVSACGTAREERGNRREKEMGTRITCTEKEEEGERESGEGGGGGTNCCLP